MNNIPESGYTVSASSATELEDSLLNEPGERFGQHQYEYHDDLMSVIPSATVPWLCKMMAVKGQLGSIYQ